MIEVGDLVRVKHAPNPHLHNRLAIVINKGTWSADIHFVDSNDTWEPRISLECLEKL